MPLQRFDTGDDLSLRHIPDASDWSLSFQIPNTLSENDRLLVDDDMSFLRDAKGDDDVPLILQASSSDKSFTLDDLTPRPTSKHVGIRQDCSSQPIPALDTVPSKVEPPASSTDAIRSIPARVTQLKAKGKLRSKSVPQHVGLTEENKSSATTKLDGIRTDVQIPESDSAPLKLAPHLEASEPLYDDEPRQSTTRRERVGTKSKRTVISGGITKSRSRGTSSTSSSTTLPPHVTSVPLETQEPSPPSQTRVLSDNADILHENNPDGSICSIAPGGVAERLVIYSQNLLTSLGPPAWTPPETTIAPISVPETFPRRKSVPENVNAPDDNPLTLSQLSPSKASTSLRPSLPAADLPGSAMRQSTKRPASSTLSQRAAKKGRSASINSDKPSTSVFPARQGAGPRAPAAEKSNSSFGSGSQKGHGTTIPRTKGTRVSNKSTRMEHPGAILKPVNESQEAIPPQLASSSSSSASSTSRLSQSDNFVKSGSSAKGRGEASDSRSTEMPRRQERTVLTPANPTKPVEFKFSVDARLEARKVIEKESLLASQKSGKPNFHEVPDFRTLHAAEEARLALRKENIVPVVPLPFQLSTDERAREREKFEEHLREKERELERVNEEKRREKEENEEREIRVLRKKAVPRAHEVPEWYKDVPKKKN